LKKYSQSEIILLLKNQNISVTIQRIEILEYLLNTLSHPSVEEIYQEIQNRFPTISKATVYNTIMALKDSGLVQEITIEKDRARYDANVEPHGHLFCATCRKVSDVPCEISVMDSKNLINSYQIYLYGTCAGCGVKREFAV
jgi:Fur family peroxide stress response transcriptional regulator